MSQQRACASLSSFSSAFPQVKCLAFPLSSKAKRICSCLLVQRHMVQVMVALANGMPCRSRGDCGLVGSPMVKYKCRELQRFSCAVRNLHEFVGLQEADIKCTESPVLSLLRPRSSLLVSSYLRDCHKDWEQAIAALVLGGVSHS